MTLPATVPLPVELRRGGPPLHVQLATQLRDLVGRGVVPAGSRLPSTRALAADLGVARSVVEQGYDQLLAEGWLVSRQGSGTYVADVGAIPRGRDPQPSPSSPGTAARERVRLGAGVPWVDPRQEAGWRRAWREMSVAPVPRDYPDPAGLAELREEIARYVARTRGVSCTPGEVVVTAGTTHALALVLATLPASAVAVEDPGYRAAVVTVRQSGRRVLDVPVDEEGLDVPALARADATVGAVYVTPAHQHPLGITMTAARRVALLEEARRRGALVVEDDYDSEFRYDVAPLPALTALDRERVVYLGTASKMLSPALRLGWLVAEPALVERVVELRAARNDHPSWPVQRAMLSLMREGHLDKLVRSARRVYAERAEVVAARLGRYGQVSTPVAGMYLTLLTEPGVAQAVRRDARREGFDLTLLEELTRSDPRTGLVIGFGGTSDAELARAVDVLDRALAGHTR
ncbi:MAG TPA: PLP-dependent aminotransferase family protein [Nocardioidaceae bacterium]